MKQLFPLLFLLLCSVSLFAQSKKGFKYLEKSKFEQALAAFSQDTADAKLRAVALYGMAKTLSEPQNPKPDFQQAMAYQARAAEAWEELKPAVKKDLTKDYKVSRTSIASLATKAEITAWKIVEKSTSLSEIDAYLDLFPKSPEHKKQKARQKQAELIPLALEAPDYAMAKYLYSRHYEFISENLPGQLELLENRLFETYLAEKGADGLLNFTRENPNHPLAYDSGTAEFIMLWNDMNLQSVINFLLENPRSGYVPYVHRKGAELLSANPLDAAALEALPETERLVVAELEWIAQGNSIDLNHAYDESQKTGWMFFIRRSAPSFEAFYAVDAMFSDYQKRRDWPAAEELLRETSPLFPEYAEWFSTRLEIVGRPDSGSLPVPVGPAINSAGNEFNPILTADGKRMYFGATDRSDNVQGEDVFLSERRDTGWTKAVLVRELSGDGNQVPVSITADGNRILVFNEGKPYQSDRTATGWTPMTPLPGLDEFNWVGNVQIAANNQVMFLEARSFTTEATDLFIMLRDKTGEWGKPIRLDSVINTYGDDRTAYLHPDLRTLYFSSNGHSGLGEMDVFTSKRLDDTWLHWSTPVNLGKNINTPDNDWSYTVSTDGSIAWFSSRTRDNGQDIFYVNLGSASIRPDMVRLVEVIVKDELDKTVTEGVIELQDAVTGAIAGAFRINPDGKPTAITVPDDKQYLAIFKKDGYYPHSTSIPKMQPGQAQQVVITWKAEKLKAGVSRELNIYFDFAQDVLKPESNAELLNIASLHKQSGYRIKLTGHTDDIGSPEANRSLSLRRAEAARNRLIELGVPPDQVEAYGKGETEPVAKNDTDENRAKNRRVVIELLSH